VHIKPAYIALIAFAAIQPNISRSWKPLGQALSSPPDRGESVIRVFKVLVG